MKKATTFMMMMALPIALGLVSCKDDDNNSVLGNDGVEETLNLTEPAEDQMSVTVTANLSTAVPVTFEESSTGAALVKRLPRVTAAIEPDTKMVLLPGSVFDANGINIGPETMAAVFRTFFNGGYLAIERPTNMQIANFVIIMLAELIEMEELTYEELYSLTHEEARAAAAASPRIDRMKARMENMRRYATRADGGDGLDDLFAEMVIMGPDDYFMQEPLDKLTTYMYSEDSEGNTTAAQAVTSTLKRTQAVSGTLADAAADWLNIVEKENEAKQYVVADTRRLSMTRAGSGPINDLIDASETFTYNGCISWKDDDTTVHNYSNRVNIRVSSWGVHNIEANKDYYYLKQNVTLRMGNDNGWKIFYPTSSENSWYKATNYGNYNRWYGSFLSQYETSMNLTGSGTIHLEAAAPNTDNNSSSTSVTVGSSSSRSETVGLSWSAGANMSGPMASVGGSYSVGTTQGTSFSMGMSQTNKELGVKKNTSGSKVTWTYKGALPQYYENVGSTIYYCHQTAANILVNDADVANEICWSVSNPSGQYTAEITSVPQTAALLYEYKKQNGYKNAPHKYEYCTAETATYTHTLLEPSRAMQTWRMNITIDQWDGTPVVGALGDLESNIRNAFPDLYANVFKVADKTPTSLTGITAVVNYTKSVMGNRLDILQSYARSWGIKQFTIHWSCDDLNVKTREGFVVNID